MALFAVAEDGKKLRYSEIDNIDNKVILFIQMVYAQDTVIHQAQNI